MQEALTRPGVLERFLAPSEGAEAVRDSWVGIWSLDADGGKGADDAVAVRTSSCLSRSARAAGITSTAGASRRLSRNCRGGARGVDRDGAHPPAARCRRVSCPVWGGAGARACDERAWCVWVGFVWGGQEVREEQVGWLVRTKADDVDEGGIAAGFSVLDSVVLVYLKVSRRRVSIV